MKNGFLEAIDRLGLNDIWNDIQSTKKRYSHTVLFSKHEHIINVTVVILISIS